MTRGGSVCGVMLRQEKRAQGIFKGSGVFY